MSDSSLVIQIDPDENALGMKRDRPVEPYPREFTTLSFPVSWPYVVALHVPARMTAAEFDAMTSFIALARSALVNP